MKFETNMYVRTKAGMIAKIIDKRDVSDSLHREEIVFILDNGNRLALHSKKVLKASHNIIDLIEVGDYVNGLIVNDIVTEIDGTKTFNLFKQVSYFGNEDINRIVTKEQFKSMEYRLEGKND